MFPTRRITTTGGDVFRDEFSLAFDGTNNYIELSGAFNYTNHAIVSWVKITADTDNKFIFDYRDGDDDGILLNINSSEKIKYEVNTSDVLYNTVLSSGVWHHIVATNNGTNTKLYLNGVEVGSSDSSGVSLDVSSSAVARIGTRSHTSPSNYFNGNISELAFYNKGLSASEVKTLYNGREPYNHKEGVCSSNLQGWWRMGDGVLDDRNGLVADQTNATLQSSIITTDLDAQFAELNTDSNNTVTYPTATSVRITTTDGSNVGIRDADLLTAGKTYKCIIDLTVHSGVGIKIQDNSAQHKLIETTGIYTFYFIANDSYFYIFRRNANPTDVTINSLSVQEVNGNAGVMTNMDTDDFEGDTP